MVDLELMTLSHLEAVVGLSFRWPFAQGGQVSLRPLFLDELLHSSPAETSFSGPCFFEIPISFKDFQVFRSVFIRKSVYILFWDKIRLPDSDWSEVLVGIGCRCPPTFFLHLW